MVNIICCCFRPDEEMGSSGPEPRSVAVQLTLHLCALLIVAVLKAFTERDGSSDGKAAVDV